MRKDILAQALWLSTWRVPMGTSAAFNELAELFTTETPEGAAMVAELRKFGSETVSRRNGRTYISIDLDLVG